MKQKPLMFMLLLTAFLLFNGCVTKYLEEKKIRQRTAISKELFQQFSEVLKHELQNAIAQGGPAGAIGVCKRVSMEKETEFSAKYPAISRVRRISLKTRNPERHTPTPEEEEYLQWAEKEWSADSEKVKSVQMSATNADTQKVHIFFPIAVSDPVCILCHGAEDQILPDIKAALSREYPNDRATGYQVGDFRGAFVVEWDL